MQIDLSTDEARILEDVLDEYLPNLRMQIGSTENFEFRQALHAREAAMSTVLARIRQSRGAAAVRSEGESR